MACTLEQRREAVALEKKRLLELEANGADIDTSLELIKFYEDNIKDEVRLKNKTRQYNKQFKDIPQSEINKLNRDNPTTKTGAKLTIIKGYIDSNDRAAYTVKYANGPKEYTFGAHAIVLDSLDAQHSIVNSSILRSEPSDIDVKEGTVILEASRINNVDALQEVAEMLANEDNIEITDSHKEHLVTIINKIASGLKKPIQEMNVYLNDKYESNNGFIVFGDEEGIYLNRGTESRVLGTDMSLMEKFVHELVHGTSHYGLTANSIALSKQKRLLTQLRSKALKVLKPSDFLGDVVKDLEAELEIAKGRLKYITEGDAGLEEFLAVGLSNEKIFNILKGIRLREARKVTNIGDSLVNFFMGLVDSLLEALGKNEKTMRGDRLLMKLVSDIGKLNKEAEYIRDNSLRGQVDRKINEYETRWSQWFDALEKKNQDLIINKLAAGDKLGPVDKFRALHMVLTGDKGTPMLQNILAIVGANEEGILQTIIRHMKHSDPYSNELQKLTLASGQIDTNREATAAHIAAIINKGFKGKMTQARKKAMYISSVMADNVPLVGEYIESDLKELYANKKAVITEIQRIKAELNKELDDGDFRYLINQTEGLAKLMMTGEGSIVQRKNAKAIATHVLSKDMVTDAMVTKIDVLTSLYALQGLDTTVTTNMVELIKSDYSGVKAVADTIKGFRDLMDTMHTPEELINRAKNYHRETYDAQVGTKIARTDMATRKQLSNEGYTLKEELPSLGLGYGGKELAVGLYVSDELVRRPMNRASVRYTGDREPGDSLWKDAIYRGMDSVANDVVKAQLENGKKLAAEYEGAIRAGKYIPDRTHVVPVLNKANNIVDYKTESLVFHRMKYLGLEFDTAMAVGRTEAHEIDLASSKELNSVVWDSLMTDMIDNAPAVGDFGSNQHRYVDISSMSGIDEVKDAASILPEEIRLMMNRVKRANVAISNANSDHVGGKPVESVITEFSGKVAGDISFNEELDKFELSSELLRDIVGEEKFDKLTAVKQRKLKSIFGKNVFKVRRDMLLDIFGVRDASLANLIPSNSSTRLLKKAIRKIEDAWKEIVKIFKIDVIIRTLPVIMGNIVSNIMYSIQYGISPLAAAQRQLEGVHLLKQYLTDSGNLIEVKAKLAADPSNEALKLEKSRLEADMNNTPIKPLIDAGLYQHIVEDVNVQDLKSNSRIARFIDSRTEGVPDLVKTGANWLFVNEKTGFFQAIVKATAYSDFVARYAQYTLGMEKDKKIFREQNDREMNKIEAEKLRKETLIRVRDAYVNYSKPDSKVLQYLNDMGFVAFSRYAVRIQAGIADLIKGKPLRFTLAMLGQELFEAGTGYNPSDIVESSIFNKEPSSWLYTPGYEKILGDVFEPQAITYYKSIFN